MKAHLIDTHLLVSRSRSSAKVKVKYQGHVSQKMGVSGALVFHKRILGFFFFFCNPLPNDKILDLTKLKALVDDKFDVNEIEIGWKKLRERRKCWLSAFSSFPTLFSEDFFLRVIWSRDCVIKG